MQKWPTLEDSIVPPCSVDLGGYRLLDKLASEKQESSLTSCRRRQFRKTCAHRTLDAACSETTILSQCLSLPVIAKTDKILATIATAVTFLVETMNLLCSALALMMLLCSSYRQRQRFGKCTARHHRVQQQGKTWVCLRLSVLKQLAVLCCAVALYC